MKVLRGLETKLIEAGFSVKRSPFGWYKSFTLKCKGHPLAESFREVGVKPVGREEVAVEEVKESKYLVIDVDGSEHPLNLSAVNECVVLDKYPQLKKFILVEEVGEVPRETPPHIKLMRRLELVDYEPASDAGHFRFYPKGALIKKLLEDFASQVAHRIGAMLIETPLIYKLEADIAEQVSRFLERDYRFEIDGRELVLRFAGDFGLFKIMSSALISYKNLPIRVYELSPSFRYERSGELVGLRRLRAFTMPDIHCFCKDIEQGKEEFMHILKHFTELTDSMEIEYVAAFRVVKEFYSRNREWFKELVKLMNKPALIELLPEMKHYWVVKHEYQFIDSVGGNAQLCTVQLDVEDSKRYGIYYVDANGVKRGCIIIHSSMGSIERWIYALLEQAAKSIKENKPPMLPTWLSPTQVRVIPVSSEYVEKAVELSEALEREGIRVDVDDRDGTVPFKVREAEREWIPYVVVYGRREAESNRLSVRVRGEGLIELSLRELIDRIKAELANKPFHPLTLPKLLSKRPQFVGRD